MKKQYFYAMALMATLSLGSCSNSSDLDSELGNGTESVEQDGQVLKLCVENGGNGISSRAGRPLFSSAAMQSINQIDLYVVNYQNKVVLKKTISENEWKNALDYKNEGHGKELSISFKTSEQQNLETGKYTIYALGYKTEHVYGGVGIEGASTTTKNDSSIEFSAESLIATLATDKKAEEIFAGKVQVEVKDVNNKSTMTTATGDKINPVLVLNRQVAGVMGYFTNIPAKVGERVPAKIRLVASNKSNKMYFTSLYGKETVTGTATNNIVNGTQDPEITKDALYFNQSHKGYTLYEIDLSEFFPELKTGKTFDQLDLDGDGYVGYKDAQHYVYNGNIPSDLSNWSTAIKGGEGVKALSGFWKNPNEKMQQLVAGSVFSGNFVIPFAQVEGTNTFEIQLLDKDNNVLKNWNVQVKQAEQVTEGMSFADGITESLEADKSYLVYSIYRNHLYSMGIKANNGPDVVDPDKPIDPTPDPKPNPDPDPTPGDKPAELTNGQDLLLHVNDNWEIIHDMIID